MVAEWLHLMVLSSPVHSHCLALSSYKLLTSRRTTFNLSIYNPQPLDLQSRYFALSTAQFSPPRQHAITLNLIAPGLVIFVTQFLTSFPFSLVHIWLQKDK